MYHFSPPSFVTVGSADEMVSFKLSVALVFLSSLVELALATGVFFPLYIYPDDNCAAWTELISRLVD